MLGIRKKRAKRQQEVLLKESFMLPFSVEYIHLPAFSNQFEMEESF